MAGNATVVLLNMKPWSEENPGTTRGQWLSYLADSGSNLACDALAAPVSDDDDQ